MYKQNPRKSSRFKILKNIGQSVVCPKMSDFEAKYPKNWNTSIISIN